MASRLQERTYLDCDGYVVACEDIAVIDMKDDGMYAWKCSDILCEVESVITCQSVTFVVAVALAVQSESCRLTPKAQPLLTNLSVAPENTQPPRTPLLLLLFTRDHLQPQAALSLYPSTSTQTHSLVCRLELCCKDITDLEQGPTSLARHHHGSLGPRTV